MSSRQPSEPLEGEFLGQSRSGSSRQVVYPPRWINCSVGEAELGRVRGAVEQLPHHMTGGITTLDVEKLSGTRHRDVFRLKIRPFRVFFRPAGAEILVLRLDRRDDHTYDDISAIERIAVVRSGKGVQVVEVGDPAESRVEETKRVPSRPATVPERQNPLTPFETSRLEALGLDRETVDLIRTYGDGIDIVTALAERGIPAETIELVGDAWYDPAPHLEIFDSGRTPTVEDIRMAEEELAKRLGLTPSHQLAALSEDDFEAVLRGSIEEWMFYLHPTQERIVRMDANGPVRVKGGPGSGKTVAALHRARYLAREGKADRVLVTTFVNALPSVWRDLFSAFAPDVADRIETNTVDGIAWSIVESVDGNLKTPLGSDSDDRRKLLTSIIEKTPGLAEAIGGPDNFGREIDEIIAGRGIESFEDYAPVQRHGRGVGLSQAQRAIVWDGYELYRSALKNGVIDYAHIRLRALQLAREGHGPRFEAVIVDEAQDLTEVHVRLLMELDTSADHRGFLVVGDGKQAIYRGGFRLLHVGLDVRGTRTVLLDRNWRNTQLIAWAADGAAGRAETEELEPDDGAPRREAPPTRLGDPAELHLVPDEASRREVLLLLVKEALEHVEPDDVAVLTRKNDGWKAAETVIKAAGVPSFRLDDLRRGAQAGVRMGSFAKSKGLEFKVVILADVSKSGWSVSPFMLQDDADKNEWWAKERRTLYVAMTRARDRLILISTPEVGGPILAVRDRFDEEDWR